MTRATLLKEGLAGVLRATSRHQDLDKYLTASTLAEVSARHQEARLEVALTYLGLVQTGATRPCALGWVVVDADRLAEVCRVRPGGVDRWWQDGWAHVPWREHGWLLHAAGVTDPGEQERLWVAGLDGSVLLAMAALRGHVIPAVLTQRYLEQQVHAQHEES